MRNYTQVYIDAGLPIRNPHKRKAYEISDLFRSYGKFVRNFDCDDI